jgi:hypothetical protein
MSDQRTAAEEIEIQLTKDYVENNIVLAIKGRKCVDGRYLPHQASGMIARPGGDCGYVMALMAVSKKKKLGLTPEQCFNFVYKVILKNGEKFYMHTDHHADPDSHIRKGLVGCGHLVKASTDKLCKDYDLDGSDVKKFVEYARNIAEGEPSLEIVNLDGEHEEKGVLIISSLDYAINANDPKMNRMYFIYDEDRDMTFMKGLVKDLNIDGVTFEDLKKESDIQLQATLNNLALGLPIYRIEFSGKKPNVTFAGKI